ncbi:HupE/UreJ family protein [Novilysobacter erysipheiresistens]|uniref:HupE/UreJ family protein n=1 Tax=Novilysobacter erysipheiresistens TaxID=1749332 RepID=A0ABU7YV05_9GAMM
MTARACWVVLLMAVALSASAHTVSVGHLDIVVPADSDAPLQVELDLSLRDLALSVPLDRNRDEQVTWGELTAARDDIEALVVAGLELSAPSGECGLNPAGLATRQYDDGAYATVQLAADCPSAERLQVLYTVLMNRDPQHRALVTIRHGGEVSTAIARAGHTRVGAALGPRASAGGSWLDSPFVTFLREGIHHILIGYDHLAFLVSLLLPAALLRIQGRWQPAPGFRSGFLHILGIATAFTVAHSITLSLAALGWVTPASRWVEAAIAASVLLAALNNVWPVVVRRLWLVGFVFGLIHGFGFAGALSELGLPDGARLWSLLGFNLGVEIGQVAVVCALLPLLFVLRHRRWYAAVVMPAVSLGIAVMAAYWLWQRLAG